MLRIPPLLSYLVTLASPTPVPVASTLLLMPQSPTTTPRPPTVRVRVANGCPECSVASATLASASLFPQAAMLGHVMPSFPYTLIGLGPFADQGCNIIFTKTAVTVYHPDGHPILSGWRDETLDRASGTSLSPWRHQTHRMWPQSKRLSHPSRHHCPVLRQHLLSCHGPRQPQ